MLSQCSLNSRFFPNIIRPSPGPFDFENLNDAVVKAEHAVRGAIVTRANKIRGRMAKGEVFPFSSVIPCNIGNPFAVGKHEITFVRQLIAATEVESIRRSHGVLPEEVCERATELLAHTPGGLGAYTMSQGIELVRQHVAEYIGLRDGYPADHKDIFLVNGGSQAVEFLIKLITANSNVGVMLPYPTYSLYTAELDMCRGKGVPYFLDEDNGWDVHIKELEKSYIEARDKGIDVRALVVINPGNPTGSVLQKETIEKIVEFADANNLMVIADEVYQHNIYDKNYPFHSFKKIVMNKRARIPLASLNSISKGFMGECGHRGGYVEFHNCQEESVAQFLKLASIALSPNSVGQVLVDAMVKPPQSVECKTIWDRETHAEILSLGRKARLLQQTLEKLPGMKCNKSRGAMYLFPRLELPQKAIEAASKTIVNGKPVKPDMLWAMELLDNTGIIVVPGSGFGQKEGTYHFRMTFLPESEIMDDVIERITQFQNKFMEKYQ
ncbi:Alanine aminotransferase 2, mitochondrial [Tritrichomonas foetus]|uniref:Alanine aminotransferase 2, mitochondrial n=1 Tax=Tritrichomonas foetus TaxID=1144522 RepID=A0A1J4KK99_9EUKA|nr:Alanine aminotransferase 2, mitochondrial [Tritrichomonas foetus]|eukprot:OHT11721.1 Alanine aminotransferase 2, mitochondrial [Tritrichomonas foetus]